MSVNHTASVVSVNDAGIATSLSGPAINGNREVAFSQAVGASQTNLLIPVTYQVANLKSIAIVSDQNCTIKTNSSGSPQETLTLTANSIFLWQYGSGVPIPVAGDVTAWYITNTPALNLKAKILSV